MVLKAFFISYLAGQLKFVDHATKVQAIVTAAMTMFGCMVGAQSFVEVSLAVMFGIGTGLLLAGAWLGVFKLMCDNITQKTRNLLLVVSLLLGAFLFGGSTQFNALAFAGERAQGAYTQSGVTEMQDIMAGTYSKNQELQGLVPDLSSAIGSFEKAIEAEFKLGRFSGTPGPGTVHSALVSIKGKLVAIRSTVEQANAKAPELQSRSEKILDEMRAILKSEKDVQRQMDKVSALSLKLAAAQSQLNLAGTAASILRQLENLPLETKVISDFSRDPAVKAGQEMALSRLQVYLDDTTESLKHSLKTYLGNPAPMIPAFESVSANAAIFLMWDQIITAWSAAIALDFAPYIFLLLLYVSASSMTEEEQVIARAMASPISSVRDMQILSDVVKSYRGNQSLIEQFQYPFPRQGSSQREDE